jgi:heme/copper-type cytochrome/quinol oxidase subunit 2
MVVLAWAMDGVIVIFWIALGLLVCAALLVARHRILEEQERPSDCMDPQMCSHENRVMCLVTAATALVAVAEAISSFSH